MSARETMHLTDEQLDDYTDGVMNDVERAVVERHLALCERCRRGVSDTREVLAWATRERENVRAPGELWPLVASSTIHLAEVRRAVIRSMRGLLITGAIVLTAATAVVTWKVARWTDAPRAADSPPRSNRHRGGAHPIAPIPPRPPAPPTPPRPD